MQSQSTTALPCSSVKYLRLRIHLYDNRVLLEQIMSVYVIFENFIHVYGLTGNFHDSDN